MRRGSVLVLAAAALSWVRGHAVDYGGDPEKIFVIGMSAGGHLAALVSTNERSSPPTAFHPRSSPGR